jgi:hypothetical protein
MTTTTTMRSHTMKIQKRSQKKEKNILNHHLRLIALALLVQWKTDAVHRELTLITMNSVVHVSTMLDRLVNVHRHLLKLIPWSAASVRERSGATVDFLTLTKTLAVVSAFKRISVQLVRFVMKIVSALVQTELLANHHNHGKKIVAGVDVLTIVVQITLKIQWLVSANVSHSNVQRVRFSIIKCVVVFVRSMKSVWEDHIGIQKLVSVFVL